MPPQTTAPGNPALTLCARWLAAMLLTVAAVLKLAALPWEGSAVFSGTGSLAFQAALVAGEGLLALWLLSGRHPRHAFKATALCFLLFGAASLFSFLQGKQSCGCFGHFKVNPGVTFVLDIAVCAVLLVALSKRTDWATSCQRIFVALGAAVAMAGLLHILLQTGTTDEMAKWRGQPFQFASAIDIGPELLKGRWALLVYSSDCSRCKALVRDYEWLAAEWEKQANGRVALLETADVSSDRQFASGLSPALPGHLEKGRTWPGSIPMLLLIKDSIIVDIRQGSVDCALDKSGLLDPTPKQTPMPKDPKNHG